MIKSNSGLNTAAPMKPPKLSVIFTLNNRPNEVMRKVFESFIGQDYQQMVIVFDRPEPGVEDFARKWWSDARGVRPTFVKVDGERGWLGPARAWNRGFAAIEHEITYCISSEVIQSPGNCERVRKHLSGPPLVVFGKAVDDGPLPVVASEEPNLLCSSKMRRPLGFIMALPTWVLRSISGFDEKFMDGYWYDDDDLTFRIWRLGVPYLFDDEVFGVHQHHDRADLGTPRGQEMIARNRNYIVSRWKSEHPWNDHVGGYATGDKRSIVYPRSAPALEEFYTSLVNGPTFGSPWPG